MNTLETKKRPSLLEVLAYENPQVIISFQNIIDVSKEEAQDIFNQLKRMLWLMNEMGFDRLREKGNMFAIDKSLVILDEMWHSFILCTAEYEKFCKDMFGVFLHHYPTIETEQDKAKRLGEYAGLSNQQVLAKLMDKKRWQYNYVFNKLGQETFNKWYVEYHKKYTPLYLAELKYNKVKAMSAPVQETELAN